MFDIDSYKIHHFQMMNPNAQFITAYLQARKAKNTPMVVFGLVHTLRHLLREVNNTENFLCAPFETLEQHMGMDLAAYKKNMAMLADYVHTNQTLPLDIRTVQEGQTITDGIVLSVTNHYPEFAWLVLYIETVLMRLWYPCSVATVSMTIRKMLEECLELSAENTDSSFMLHDFGARSVSCKEQAIIGGLAHLTQFRGTDNIAAIMELAHPRNRDYYQNLKGYSIPALEHNVILSYGGKPEGEARCFDNVYANFETASIPTDTFDVNHALSVGITPLTGKTVFRFDSGDPVASVMNGLAELQNRFGTCRNRKGFHVLPERLRVIQGDGIDAEVIKEILYCMFTAGFSAENIVFGMGGNLLQAPNRDDLGFAYKICMVDGVPVSKTTPGKESIAGTDHIKHLKPVTRDLLTAQYRG